MLSKTLTPEEQNRYARHIALAEIGECGQLRLKNGSVLLIGCGGLGSPIALYLAAAGVGRIGLIDGDRVSLSNLQRQVAHTTADIGRFKARSARDKMLAINPDIQVEAITEFATPTILEQLLPAYDFIIEATDSLDMKYLVDDLCLRLGRPYNHGAISEFEGQTMTILPGSTTFRQLFPEAPAQPENQNGVNAPRGPLGIVPGILGTIQATEAIKYLTGIGTLLTDRLLRFNALTLEFTTLKL